MTDESQIDWGGPLKFAYSEPEWAAVVAAFPIPVAANDEIDKERKGLESVATACLNLMHHHRRRNAKESPTEYWKRTRKQIAADLADAEKTGTIASVLFELREELRHADAAVEGFGMLGKVHQRRGDPARDWLYVAALAMWRRLGGKMGITRTEYGRAKPSGPVIDFMIAVLTPVLMDNTPGAEALRKFIRKRKTAISG
jgi:hypothetical protein